MKVLQLQDENILLKSQMANMYEEQINIRNQTWTDFPHCTECT